jgi:hypothetical protein
MKKEEKTYFLVNNLDFYTFIKFSTAILLNETNLISTNKMDNFDILNKIESAIRY